MLIGLTKISRDRWLSIFAAVVITDLVLMSNLSMIAQTKVGTNSVNSFWITLARLSEPPLQMWLLLLIPCAFPVLLISLFSHSEKWLKLYVIVFCGVVIVLGFSVILKWDPIFII